MGSESAARTNMPGLSAPSGFGTSICVDIVCRSGSYAPDCRTILPLNGRPAYSRAVTSTSAPILMLGATFCGTSTNTRTGSAATSVNIGVPLPSVTSAPRSTVRVVIVPANGAVTFENPARSWRRRTFASAAAAFARFAASVASSVAAWACVCSTCARATSCWSARPW